MSTAKFWKSENEELLDLGELTKQLVVMVLCRMAIATVIPVTAQMQEIG